MADDPHNTSDVLEPVSTGSAKEDAETTAARRELKQTSISEKVGQDAQQSSSSQEGGSEDDDTDKAAAARRATPDTDSGDARNSRLKEHVSSPKKKRAHAELVGDGSAAGEASSKPTNTAVAQTRTEESEPEKKRPRDRESTRRRSQDGEESGGSTRSSLDIASSAKGSVTGASKSKSKSGSTTDKLKTTSSSAFASSGFAKLAASTTSPFGALAAAGKPSLFGASSSRSSGSFSVLGGPKPAAAPAPAPKLSFGGDSSASPFAAAGLNGKGSASVFSKPFGGSFGGGGGFGGGSTFGGSSFGGSSLSALSTFGKPGGALRSDKPAKPFGAPDSDGEDDSENEDDEGDDTKGGEGESDKEEIKDTDKEKDEPKAPEDEKKVKLRKIVVDDGEGNEVTLLAVRAKMFLMEKGVGWKERGAGMLKVNVPRSSIEMDDFGHPEPNSFDASVLDDDNEDESCARKNVRLIMRQDHTLRVILNTPIVPAMKFQLNQKLKAAFVLFTAFEDGEAKQVQMKLSEANATLFISLMDMIKKQLSDI
ncbi:hypothetical protein B0T25DRAFT_184011 [Lasiosphaeria hispida]|uniref:RanBD1 domain-containing protein n=1 Tax=Lasiosphaeria hispida TaxID=260671 RepID=A0AAJ0HGR3_9PEZI|nr:hypothetical protein B0T25DRAFT_184011 [Lasiosphaeria hispida]